MKINSLILFAVFSLFLFSCDDGIKFDNPNDINSDAYNPSDTDMQTNDNNDKTDTASTNDEENQNRDDSDSTNPTHDDADSNDDSGDSVPDERDSDDDSDDTSISDEDTGNNTVVTLPECNESTTSFPCKDSSTDYNHIWSEKYDTMKWQTAVDLCISLNLSNYGGYSNGWHLPTISELRTLIRNCPSTQMPDGSCGVIDSCLSYNNCWSDNCYCSDMEIYGGYYSKLGDNFNITLWSSSIEPDYSNAAWVVDFRSGYVLPYKGIANSSVFHYVRCVRNAN